MKSHIARVLFAALSIVVAAPAAAAQDADVAGIFLSVTADPLDPKRPPFQQYTVRLTDGRTEHVTLTAAQLQAVGGVGQLERRNVRLGVTAPARLPRFGVRVGSAEAPYAVTAIRDVEPLRVSDVPPALRDDAKPAPYAALLCRFPDFPNVTPGSVADADRVMGTTYPGAAHFFDEVSDGRLDVATGSKAFGWYVLPKTLDEYMGGSSFNTSQAAIDCATAADADVFFPDFAGINFIFNTGIGCCAYGGLGGLVLDGQAKAYGMTWLHGDALWNVGILKHEMGHSLGLQHSSGPYGLTYDSKWDVMSIGAWYAVPGTSFLTGSHINAYGKRQLGWIPEARQFTVTPGTHTIFLESTANPGDNANYLMARVPAPAFSSTEYFTLEARGVSGYDAPLPGAGVVMHRVGGGGATSSNVVDPDGNFEPSDAGAVLVPGEWYLDRANGLHVSVEERVGNAFRVTIRLNDFPRVVLDPVRYDTIAAGAGTLVSDSAYITIAGTGSSTAWTAALLQNGPAVLTTSGGTGSGWVRWSIDPRALGTGQYAQTIRVRVGELAQAEMSLRIVVPATVELTAGLSATVLTDSAIAGRQSFGFVSARLGGTGSATASWSVASDAPWITVITPTGTGRSDVRFSRDAASLAPGVHVARLTLTVPGAVNSPVVLVDSLRVLAAPTIAVTSRGATRTVMPQGARAQPDSMFVQLSPEWAQSGAWFGGLSTGQWLGLATSFPRTPGSGWFRFSRAPRDLPPGTYPAVWTIRLSAASDVLVEVHDTLVVVPAPAAIRLSRASRRDSVASTFIPIRDSVWVQTEGPNSTSAAWFALPSSFRIFTLSASLGGQTGTGMGPGWLHYVRNLTESASPGLYVDTITVSFTSGTGASARIVDSLWMFGAPAMSLGSPSRRTQMLAGGDATTADSADVALTGWESGSIGWTASAKATWLALVTATGSGSGRVRWTRNAASLAPGVYVDTISVVAAATGTPLRFVDTLSVYAPLTVSVAERPGAVMGAGYEHVLQAEGGPDAARTWSIVAGALPTGLTMDATGRVAGIPEESGTFTFTARVAAGADAAQLELSLTVTRPVLAQAAVLDDLLGAAPLGADHKRFLDLQGNRNGRVDVGDVRAWLMETAGAAAVADLPRLLRERQVQRGKR